MKIFVADYLPLKNKGEEAIVRGLESLFKKKYNEDIEFCVLDVVNESLRVGDVDVFPSYYCYPNFSNPKMREFKGSLMMLIMCCITIIGLYPYRRRVKQHLIPKIKECDKVLLAHDGFMNPFCAALGLYLYKQGIDYSIIGAGFVPVRGKLRWFYRKVYSSFFNRAALVVLREKTAFEYVKRISYNNNVFLLPDPAFNSKIENKNIEKANSVLDKYGYSRKQLNIGVTVCENSISFSTSFKDSSNKSNDHRLFMASLINQISKTIDCTFYFLPHCIENGAGDDLAIARDIFRRLPSNSNIKIITEDLPVMDIKGIISDMDMIIGERTHSIINSISCGIPFLNLTCSADIRSHDIIEKDCGLGEFIMDLDKPELENTVNKVLNIVENRNSIKSVLKQVNALNEKKFDGLSNLI